MKRELFGLTDEHGDKVSIVLGGDSMPTDGNAYWDIIQIKALVPVEKEKQSEFKVGDWVAHDDDIYRIEEIEKDGWANGDTPGGGWHKKHLRLATPQEIEDHLRKIAKEKGFLMGKTFFSAYSRTNYIISNDKIEYLKPEDILLMGDNAVYYQGKWAEIIPDKKKLPLPKTKDELHLVLTKFRTANNISVSNGDIDLFVDHYED